MYSGNVSTAARQTSKLLYLQREKYKAVFLKVLELGTQNFNLYL